MIDEPEQKLGHFKGCHYTTYVEEVKRLKRENMLMEAEGLLVFLIETVEKEALSLKIVEWGKYS